jgi:hypothetical protein
MKLTYDGRPVILGAVPDPRAWLGREHERPQELVDAGHFEKFDRRRGTGQWVGGTWKDTDKALQEHLRRAKR